jgi:hypothetical protein
MVFEMIQDADTDCRSEYYKHIVRDVNLTRLVAHHTLLGVVGRVEYVPGLAQST